MTKLNVQFNERQNDALGWLAVELGTTKAGVIRRALSLMEVAIREREMGRRIAVVRDGRVIKEIVGMFIHDK